MIPKTDIPGLRGKSLCNPGMVFHETGAPHPFVAVPGHPVQRLGPVPPGSRSRSLAHRSGQHSNRRRSAAEHRTAEAAHTSQAAENAIRQPPHIRRPATPHTGNRCRASETVSRLFAAGCTRQKAGNARIRRHASTGIFQPAAGPAVTPRPFWDRRRARGSAWESRSCPSNSRNGQCCPATNATGAWHARA